MAYRGRRTAEQTTSGSLQKDAKYDKMIKEALSNLKERCGSTRHNIARFITSNYKTEDKDEVLKDLSIALKRGVENNSLILMSGFGASARYCLGDKIEISQLKQSVSKVTETAADESRPSTSARRRACKKEDTIEHSQGNTSSSKDIRTNASKKGHQKKKRSKGDVRRKDTPKISAGVKGQARKRGVETGSKLRRGVETSSKSRRSTQELEHRDEKGDSTKNKTKTSPNKRQSKAHTSGLSMHSIQLTSPSDVLPAPSTVKCSLPDKPVPSHVSEEMILMQEHAFELDRMQVEFLHANFYVGRGCWITGTAISRKGKIIMADRMNYEVKLFSADFNVLSSLPLDDQPWSMSICRRDDVAVPTSSNNVYIVSFLDDKLEIRQILKLAYMVSGITMSRGHLFVTADNSLKKITISGHVYWSTSTDKTGQELFRNAHYVTSVIVFDGDTYLSRIVVTDFLSKNIILVDSETGEVLKVSKRKLKGINGVTRDRFNNIYICSSESNAVSVMPCDLSEERVILTTKSNKHLHPDVFSDELYDWPQSIAYDFTTNQLVISNHGAKCSDVCHVFRLLYNTSKMKYFPEWEMCPK